MREGARWEAQGAYHGAEIPYIFNTHAEWVKTTKADRQLTTAVQKYWVNFARSGNPNEPPGELPAWPQWNPDLPQVVVLDDPVQSQPAPDQWLCQLLDGS